jgi:hypothetical protein
MTTSKEEPMAKDPHDARATEGSSPVIVDLGKQPRRRIKRLLRGEGKLMGDIRDCIAELRRGDKIASTAEPVIVVVRQKRAKGSARWPGF